MQVAHSKTYTPKVSIVMASYLGDYPTAIKGDREQYFKEAIKSALAQTLQEIEIIIVSDGCEKTINIYNKNFKGHPKIKLVEIEKAPMFFGKLGWTRPAEK